MPRKKSKLTDKQLAKLARQYKEAQQQVKEWEEIKRDIGKEICAEMDARGTHLIETDGVRVTDTVQERTIYDYFGLADVLPKKIMNKIRPQAVDASALGSLVQAGVVDAGVVADYTEVVQHARYPTVSYTE